MKALVLLMTLVMVGWADEENSAQRLENMQRGMAEASWPRKPDNRISPLSGKIKEVAKISLATYGAEKEFPADRLDYSGRATSLAGRPAWQREEAPSWTQERWAGAGELADQGSGSRKFQPEGGIESKNILAFRGIEKASAPDWSSRGSRTAARPNGVLRRYEGRLTRVREQVWTEETRDRDLGPGRQEKFRPDEVERLLSQPIGDFGGEIRGQSRAPSPPAVAGN